MRTQIMRVCGLIAFATSAQASAQEASFPGASELGAAVAQMATKTWQGPRVPAPVEMPRPELAEAIRADGVTLHADQVDARVERAAVAVAAFARYLQAGGFDVPLNDGGRGGDDDFDLYLSPAADIREAHSDGRARWSFHDRVSAYAVVDPITSGADLSLCSMEAYARGALLSLLPDEAVSWRNAFASWLTWRYTGRFGCADAADAQQAAPERSWIGVGHPDQVSVVDSVAADQGAGGGLFLAMLSERHSAGTGVFLRETLQIARQRTWEGEGFRGSPDLWQALEVSIDAAGGRLNGVISDFGRQRYFLGARAFTRTALSDQSATPPVGMQTALSELPYHSEVGPTLQPHGTAYLLVDVRDAPPRSRLRVWLRGEYGVEWSLVALRLDEDGRPAGEVSAPPRRGDPRAYVPVEQLQDAAYVLAVATNLSHRLPDADELEDPNARAFRFIVDVAEDEASD